MQQRLAFLRNVFFFFFVCDLLLFVVTRLVSLFGHAKINGPENPRPYPSVWTRVRLGNTTTFTDVRKWIKWSDLFSVPLGIFFFFYGFKTFASMLTRPCLLTTVKNNYCQLRWARFVVVVVVVYSRPGKANSNKWLRKLVFYSSNEPTLQVDIKNGSWKHTHAHTEKNKSGTQSWFLEQQRIRKKLTKFVENSSVFPYQKYTWQHAHTEAVPC